jgi:hypothetical protein
LAKETYPGSSIVGPITFKKSSFGSPAKVQKLTLITTVAYHKKGTLQSLIVDTNSLTMLRICE